MVEEHFPGGVHHEYAVPADTDLPSFVLRASEAKDRTFAGTDIAKRFRRITMQLLYSALHARPDVASAVAYISRVQGYPSPELLKRAERVLIYLHGTKHLKLTYRKTGCTLRLDWAPRVRIEGVSDASFDVAHSTSGYGISAGSAYFSWAVKKQESVALYTQEAEIHAGSLAACDIAAHRGILEFIGQRQTGPTVLKMDNSSAIDLAHDPMHYERSKHIHRRDLFIRELVERGVVKPEYVPTSKNTADALTKPLTRSAFIMHRNAMLGI